MHRLRKRIFVDAQNWDIPTFKDMEYDAYDNPAATYLVHLNTQGEVDGMVRVYPTDRPYMIKDVWPEVVEKIPMPSSEKIYEGSRFVIDSDVSKDEKKIIKEQLVCAMMEYGLENGIEYYVGVMPDNFWKSVFIRSGWTIEKLGKTIVADDGSEIYAAKFEVSNFHYYQIRRITGISTKVLSHKEATERNRTTKVA
ncbi:MAG: hypothetical protein LRY54_04580 [Alphaproteobacteria bacterium]|nr:hypothetical protein [Alphaproteobacteria bacterium]